MLVPNRHGSSESYRYGFNGKEKDDEVKGEGLHLDYGFRIYDPRIGRFLSQDPLFKSYPWYTPYQFAGNKPVAFIDLDGLEEANVQVIGKYRDGSVLLRVTRSDKPSNSNKGKGVSFNYGEEGLNELTVNDNLSTIINKKPSESLNPLNKKINTDGYYDYGFQLSYDLIEYTNSKIIFTDQPTIISDISYANPETNDPTQVRGTSIGGGFVSADFGIKTNLTFQAKTSAAGGGGFDESGQYFIDNFVLPNIGNLDKDLASLNQNRNDVTVVKFSVNEWLYKQTDQLNVIINFFQSNFPNATISHEAFAPGCYFEATPVNASDLFDVPILDEE
jgi:RHS repeat-associated protein